MEAKLSLTVQGTIDSCTTLRSNDLYCKYSFTFSGDWNAYQGATTGITTSSHAEGTSPAIFNAPFQVSFSSKSPFGWPQIIIAVYGLNHFGNDMIVGYGGIHVPTSPGRHEVEIPLFTPEAGSFFKKFASFFTGLYPELIDTNTVASGENREVLQTTSQGTVRLSIAVTLSDPEPLLLHFEE
ncbi:B9 domain-containing protein 1 [Tritrichomonas foetus]|uniref:B9 domain-containing protein 1 n=1 Tax=Tritrichomonas foetus TaxID=1144522 RepID=A0A1J4JZH4_9EUKA|nr:B9 domain-containing protein 1 [Tritrichomonas foetus]|eukprot:OHT04082.1 B9 domain-containing protein 1 [Tritrichomonas foetus]